MPRSVSPSNFNPMINTLDWADSTGFGFSPSSGLKFKINKFSTLELVDHKSNQFMKLTDTSSTIVNQQSTDQSSQPNHLKSIANNQQNDNQQENKILSERMKICPKCGKSKYRSTFYRKGKFCSQECSFIAKGKKVKRKKRTKRLNQQDQYIQSSQITVMKCPTKNSSLNLSKSIDEQSDAQMTIDTLNNTVVQQGKKIKNSKKIINKKQDLQTKIVQIADAIYARDALQINDVVMKDTSNKGSKNTMKSDHKIKSKEIKMKNKDKSVKLIGTDSNHLCSKSRSIDEDSNRLSLESIYSFSEQDLVRQLSSFVNTLNPIEIIVEWTSDRVSDFVSILPECLEYAHKFKDENIDGESFLLLSQNDLINILEIKLYSALKIYDVICQIRKNLLKLV